MLVGYYSGYSWLPVPRIAGASGGGDGGGGSLSARVSLTDDAVARRVERVEPRRRAAAASGAGQRRVRRRCHALHLTDEWNELTLWRVLRITVLQMHFHYPTRSDDRFKYCVA